MAEDAEKLQAELEKLNRRPDELENIAMRSAVLGRLAKSAMKRKKEKDAFQKAMEEAGARAEEEAMEEAEWDILLTDMQRWTAEAKRAGTRRLLGRFAKSFMKKEKEKKKEKEAARMTVIEISDTDNDGP